MQGVISDRRFQEPPQVGQSFDFVLKGQEDGLWLLVAARVGHAGGLGRGAAGLAGQAKVTGQNTGGLECKIGPLAAFMPASRSRSSTEDDLAQYIGQTVVCLVVEVDPARSACCCRAGRRWSAAGIQAQGQLGSHHERPDRARQGDALDGLRRFVELGNA